MRKYIERLFYTLIYLLAFSNIPQAIIAIINRVPLISSMSYSFQYIERGLPNDFPLIRFGKDILIVLLLILMIIQIIKKGIKKFDLFILIILLAMVLPLGIFSLMFSDEFNIFYVIAGFRILLYLLTFILFFNNYFDYKISKNIIKHLDNIIIIELIIIIFHSLQVIQYFHTINLVKYRLIGTFQSSGLLGQFGLLYATFKCLHLKRMNNRDIKLIAIAGILCLVSGTRITIVLYLVVLMSAIFIFNTNIKNNYKLFYANKFIYVVIASFSLNMVEKLAERGDAFAAQFENGRIGVILNYIKECSIKELVIGKGIGFGTNASVSFKGNIEQLVNSQSSTMDGTINIIITQFGLIITSMFIIFLILSIFKIIKLRVNSEKKFMLIVVISIIILVGNILEQYLALLIIFLCYYEAIIQSKVSVEV